MPETRKNSNNSDTYQFWYKEIVRAKDRQKAFIDRGEIILKRYRSEMDSSDESHYSILYSNTETLLPLLYNQTPKAEVRVARSVTKVKYKLAAEVLETLLDQSVSGCQDFDAVMLDVIKDMALPGRGIAREDYIPATELKSQQGEEAADTEELVYEESVTSYWPWKKFYHDDAERWEDNRFIAYEHQLSREDFQKDERLKEYEHKVTFGKPLGQKASEIEEVTVYEIWDKSNRERLYICEGYGDKPLVIEEDPYKLRGFYNTPKPLCSVLTSDSQIPMPFFKAYEDQAIELDEITTRIMLLTRELKRRGVYDASHPEVKLAVEAEDNEFIAIKNWARFAGTGGIQAIVEEMDITRIAEVIIGLYKQRQEILTIIYQVMGLADIMRGSTDPGETAKAQKIKARFGTLRVDKIRRDVQRYAKDIINLKAEIIAENFSPETIVLIADIEDREVVITPEQKDQQGNVVVKAVTSTIPAVDWVKEVVLPVIQDQEPRPIAINVETDSTVALDEMEEQQRAVDYVQVLTGFVASLQQITPLLGEETTSQLFMDITSKFKMSRALTEKFQTRMEEIKQGQGPQKQPDPELLKLQFQEKKLQVEATLEMESLKLEAQKLQNDAFIKQQETDLKSVEMLLKSEAVKAEAANPKDNAVVGV